MQATAAPAQTSSSQFKPSASPLHPPSVMHNARVLSSTATVSGTSLHRSLNKPRLPAERSCSGSRYTWPRLHVLCTDPSQLAACFSGLVAGILGLTNQYGVLLYLLTSFLSASTTALIKCKGDIGRYVPQAHSGMAGVPGQMGGGGGGVSMWKGWLGLMGIGQENLLGFLLFWIGSYALIHGKSTISPTARVLKGD